MLHGGSLSSKHGLHAPSGSFGPQNWLESRRLTRQQSSRIGFVHEMKSSIQTALRGRDWLACCKAKRGGRETHGGSARYELSGRLRSASSTFASERSSHAEKREQKRCTFASSVTFRPSATK